MKKDGTYAAIMSKWLGSDTTASESTGDADAKATPVKSSYKIVMDSSFAPFEYQNDAGKYVGIDVELIKAIAKTTRLYSGIEQSRFRSCSKCSSSWTS